MIATRLFSAEDVKEQLDAWGCEQVDGGIEDSTCWKTPWGFHFFLPALPPDGMCPEHSLEHALEQIEASKPACNS